MRELGFNRSASECRTKSKSLRKLYKQAVLQNSTSGAGRSKFIWYNEMANIFRTDASIHPLRTMESESSRSSAAATEAMQGGSENLCSITLFEDSEAVNNSNGASETSAHGSPPDERSVPSTSGCSSSQSPATPVTAAAKPASNYSAESTNYEATLDPATRLALIRKRKQRTTAAARLDDTLSGFVDWVRVSDDRKETTMNARDHQDMLFQKQVIDNLQVASTALLKLTQFLTEAGTEGEHELVKKKPKKQQKFNLVPDSPLKKGPAHPLQGVISDSDTDYTNSMGSANESEIDSENEGSQSLLAISRKTVGQKESYATKCPQSTPVKHTKTLQSSHLREPITSTQRDGARDPSFEVSPYLIVKQEKNHRNSAPATRTPTKRKRLKKIIFSP